MFKTKHLVLLTKKSQNDYISVNGITILQNLEVILDSFLSHAVYEYLKFHYLFTHLLVYFLSPPPKILVALGKKIQMFCPLVCVQHLQKLRTMTYIEVRH